MEILNKCACPLYPIQMFMYHALSFVGGKSKTDDSAERRNALDKETMSAIYGKSWLALHSKSHTVWVVTTFVFEFTS